MFMINNTSDISDAHITVRIRNDDKDAFKFLYDRYSAKLYYFSLKYLHNIEEAEDLIQSIFIRIWEHRKSLDPEMDIKSYMYKSTINSIYNNLKRKALHFRYIEESLLKGEPHSNITYEEVFFHEFEDSVTSIIESLPAQQQKIYKLSRFRGLSNEEIAQKLFLSVRTIENQIYRATKIIKTKLEKIF